MSDSVHTFAADLEGTELVLPMDTGRDYIVQIHDRGTGELVLFSMLEKHRERIVWKRQNFDQWEGFTIEPDRYRAVVIW